MKNEALPLLEMKNVSVMRGENRALDRLSLRIEAGEHVCILGPNGSGKSTLIKTITRECYPLVRDDSSMAILGRALWNVFALRSRLGIVSPDLLAACTTDTTRSRPVASVVHAASKSGETIPSRERSSNTFQSVRPRIAIDESSRTSG